MIRFVVTGCGQSGTMFTSKLLTAVGLECTHETVFSGWGADYETVPDWRSPAHLGDSSFSAVPFLDELSGVTVVHLVRPPLDQIGAVVGQGLLDQVPAPPWVSFIHHHIGVLDVPAGVPRAAAYWVRWNELVAAESDLTWTLPRIGDGWQAVPLVSELADRVGVDVPASVVLEASEQVPGDVNSRAHKRRAVRLRDLGGWGDAVVSTASRLGVPLTVLDGA